MEHIILNISRFESISTNLIGVVLFFYLAYREFGRDFFIMKKDRYFTVGLSLRILFFTIIFTNVMGLVGYSFVFWGANSYNEIALMTNFVSITENVLINITGYLMYRVIKERDDKERLPKKKNETNKKT